MKGWFNGLIIFIVFSLHAHAAATWNYELAPYLWGSTIEGTIQSGPYRFHIDESFTELVKHLDFGAMVYVTAYRNNLGIFFNGIYSQVSDNVLVGRFDINTSSIMTIDSAGLSYKLIPLLNSQWSFEPYAGARYTFNNTKIKINRLFIQQKHDWTDGIIGTRLHYPFNSALNFEGGADYGLGDHSNSYNLIALLGYQSPNHFNNTRFYLGYRFLHQNYNHGHNDNYYSWNINLFGPMAGFAYHFQ